jgi:hypothetical protein
MDEQTSTAKGETDAVYLCQEWKLHLRARKEAELEKGYLALATGPLFHLKGGWKSSETVKIYVKHKRFYVSRELLVSNKFSTRLRRTDSKRSASP